MRNRTRMNADERGSELQRLTNEGSGASLAHLRPARAILSVSWISLLSTVVLFLAGCRPVQLSTAASVTATATKPDDKINVIANENQTVIDIRSASGIGGAEITLSAEAMQRPLILRLHLAGLEEFRLTSGDLVELVSVASSPPHTVREAVRDGVDAPEEPITPASPFWLDVQIMSSDAAGDPAIPLQDGYFEITVPPAVLERSGGTLVVNWIDFYR